MRVNGRSIAKVSALDRGLHFGDGVFETIAWQRGSMPLWAYHLARLSRGAQQLQIEAPSEAVWLDDIDQVTDGRDRAVVKLMLTRGTGGRGYAPPPRSNPTRVTIAYPFAGVPDASRFSGVRLRVCDWRLPSRSQLAGIKHLNRLDQVMARAEWDDPDIGDGLMLDDQDQIAEATASNVFFRRDELWLTPTLRRAGVHGTMRAWLIDHASVQQCELGLADVVDCDACFICNAVTGILPVREIIGLKHFAIDAVSALRDVAPIPMEDGRSVGLN